MAATPLLKRQARAYLRIADRQLAMAGALLAEGFYEGTIFHCSVSAPCTPMSSSVR